MSEIGTINYHKDTWGMLVLNEHLPSGSTATCDAKKSRQWVDPANPAPAGQSITGAMLSQVAYCATKLSSREVTLSPASDSQKVNLATYAKFDQPVNRIWVTAQLPAANLAATVVAVPEALRIDAGTDYADPKSCSYPFNKSGTAHQVDTSNASCNVTYRKATTSTDTYPLQAQITWRVTWTASASPDGPPQPDQLPDGNSTSEQAVSVQEIQTVVR